MSECNSIESAEKTYCQRNKRIILKRAKDYYENDKERLREQARDKYRNLSEEEKNKKKEYGRKRNRNMSKEYQINYSEAKKLTFFLRLLLLKYCF